MTSVAKLKERARKLEQKEDWKAAIEAYRKALDSEERTDDAEVELPLYNRVGDLYLRLGQTDEAVTYYEAAADKYAESGFYNNAIALCNKALRHRPDRAHIYLKLSRLAAEQGFLPDARRWILEYAERQMRGGNHEAAFHGIEEYADDADDPEARQVLARHLAGHGRQNDALNQLRKAHATWSARGDASAAERVLEEARSIHPSIELGVNGAAPSGESARADALDRPFRPGAPVAGGLDGLETHRVGHEAESQEPEPEGLAGLEPTGRGDAVEEEEAEPEPLPLLDTGWDAVPAPEEDAPEEDAFSDGEAAESLAELDAAPDREEEPLPPLDAEAAAPPEAKPDTEGAREGGIAPGRKWPDDELAAEPSADRGWPEEDAGEDAAVDESRRAKKPWARTSVGDDAGEAGVGAGAGRSSGPDEDEEELLDVGMLDLSFGQVTAGSEPPPDWDVEVDEEAVLGRARELVSRGLSTEAMRELNILMEGEPGPDMIRAALQVVTEISRRDPSEMAARRRRVELASMLDHAALTAAALEDLADALSREGSGAEAQAIYRRVLELDPANEAARNALRSGDASDERTEAASAVTEPDARSAAPSSPEAEPDARSAAPSSPEAEPDARPGASSRERSSADDHYDLGLAFKEMGLVDQAVAEFQAALGEGEERLKVYEELGQCYMLKREFDRALDVLRRALELPSRDERELLGVYYHLGRCHEELNQRAEARDAYRRILHIDDGFADVPDRVARL